MSAPSQSWWLVVRWAREWRALQPFSWSFPLWTRGTVDAIVGWLASKKTSLPKTQILETISFNQHLSLLVGLFVSNLKCTQVPRGCTLELPHSSGILGRSDGSKGTELLQCPWHPLPHPEIHRWLQAGAFTGTRPFQSCRCARHSDKVAAVIRAGPQGMGLRRDREGVAVTPGKGTHLHLPPHLRYHITAAAVQGCRNEHRAPVSNTLRYHQYPCSHWRKSIDKMSCTRTPSSFKTGRFTFTRC